MPFVNTSSLPVIERLPGWEGALFSLAEYDLCGTLRLHARFFHSRALSCCGRGLTK